MFLILACLLTGDPTYDFMYTTSFFNLCMGDVETLGREG